MSARIPLWLDIRHVEPARRPAFLQAAQAAGVERVLSDAPIDAPHALVDGEQVLVDGAPAGRFIHVHDGASQEAAAQAQGMAFIQADEWTIIPLENLIAARRDRPGTLFAIARDASQAGVFRDTLDRGVHGVLLQTDDPAQVHEADAVLRAKGMPSDDESGATADITLVPARITAIEDAGPGDRVCIDTTSILAPGEGMLVANTARSFVLVHAETIETEFVRARPFRINVGAVHAYVMGPGGRTQYLSEIRAGQQVLIVGPEGQRIVSVGRAKIEHRPHLLIKWDGEPGPGSAILQNAETIRLVRPDGEPVSITALSPGDEVLVHYESAARHFGMPVDERLEER